jgi:hypothetical protein
MVDDGEKNPDAPELEAEKKAATAVVELTADEKAAKEKAAKIEK